MKKENVDFVGVKRNARLKILSFYLVNAEGQ
jgi:hypothetical protein